MEEDNIMTLLESNLYNFNGDHEDQDNPIKIDDHQQTSQLHSLLRLMKISNEFVAIKNSMEMIPLPGNVEQRSAHNLSSGLQVGEFSQAMKATDLIMSFTLSTEASKQKIKELAENAMEEVTRLFTEGEPLWQHDLDRGIEILNMIEYETKFNSKLDNTLDEIIRIISSVDAPLGIPDLDELIIPNNNIENNKASSTEEDIVMQQQEQRPLCVHHASREVGYVQMPAISVVELLMDVRLLSFVFSEMLSRATVLGIISPGLLGTPDGALQMMTAEYHGPSPLLSTRQCCFGRYCKELSNNTYAIADFSLECLIENPLMNCKRRPSGCLIHGLPDGNTQVTWIEHTEAEIAVIHPIFKSVVSSELVFSAKHWVDTLARQSQHLDVLIQHSFHGLHKEIGPFRKEQVLRLAERMRREFYGLTSATKGNAYKQKSIKGGENIRIKISEKNEQSPTLFTITTSSWFPFSAKTIFSFLGNNKNRTKWDALAHNDYFKEVFRVHSGQGSNDIVSIAKMVDEKGGGDTLFLQEKQENGIVSYIIFSPITYDSLISLSNGGDINDIPVLPSGFAILSNKYPSQEDDTGTIVTLLFQLIDSSLRAQNIPKKTIRKLYNLVNNTISSIRAALFETNPAND